MAQDQPPARKKLPDELVSPGLTRVCRFLTWVIIRIFYGYTSSGGELVPKEGPVILAPNHTSFLDPAAGSCAVRRPVHYLAGAKLFKNPFFGWLLGKWGAVPVDLGRSADRAGYEAALRLLQRGNVVCIYPEGTRSDDGKLHELKMGVARLALATGAAVVPVAITGAHRAWPRDRKLPRPFVRITTRVLPPIHPRDVKTPAERRAESERILSELAAAIRSGTGEAPPPPDSPATQEQRPD